LDREGTVWHRPSWRCVDVSPITGVSFERSPLMEGLKLLDRGLPALAVTDTLARGARASAAVLHTGRAARADGTCSISAASDARPHRGACGNAGTTQRGWLAYCAPNHDRDARRQGRHKVVQTLASSKGSMTATRRPRGERQHPVSASHQRPPPRCTTKRRCGRAQCSQRAPARPNRIVSDSCGQSIE